jgi:CheY-like chemotaxis protein
MVDDNHETCTLVQALLRHDFTVEFAHDGFDAQDRLRTRNYAAVLLDLRMPLLDGFGVLDGLKEARPDILAKIVIVTASLRPSDVERVSAYGIHSLIPKPFDVEHFVSTVRRCASGHGDRPLAPLLSGGMLLLLADLLRQRWML